MCISILLIPGIGPSSWLATPLELFVPLVSLEWRRRLVAPGSMGLCVGAGVGNGVAPSTVGVGVGAAPSTGGVAAGLVGAAVGAELGAAEGLAVGAAVGTVVVGLAVGDDVGGTCKRRERQSAPSPFLLCGMQVNRFSPWGMRLETECLQGWSVFE